MAYGITSEKQVIDSVAINSGCDIINDAASDFKKCGNIVKEAGAMCDKEALSIDKTTYEESIAEVGDEIIQLESRIVAFTDEIRRFASKIRTAQMDELQDYKAAQAAKEAEASSGE